MIVFSPHKLHNQALTNRIFTFGQASMKQHLSLSISQTFQCMLLSEIFLMVPNFICTQISFWAKKSTKLLLSAHKKSVDQALTGKISKFCLSGLMQLPNLPISHVFQCILHSEIFINSTKLLLSAHKNWPTRLWLVKYSNFVWLVWCNCSTDQFLMYFSVFCIVRSF